MSTKIYHRITAAGQIVRCVSSEEIVTNPEAILTQLMASGTGDTTPSNGPPVRCLYNLGEGVSAFRRVVGSKVYYWNSIQLGTIPFLTSWELRQDPNINNGKHYICPWNGEDSKRFDIGAPMPLPIPNDLIVHFHVEYQHPPSVSRDIQLPQAHELTQAAEYLYRYVSRYYLTCFSRSRNTCVNLPLPNLYPDCHLCVGTAYDRNTFYSPHQHSGLVTSIKSFLKAWSDTAWNQDLLQGSDSVKTAQYQRFVRFDAATGAPLPFSGCADWDVATSTVPLEEVYRPWICGIQAQPPASYAEDEEDEEIDEVEPIF